MYYALIRFIKFIFIPMVTVILFYRKRKQKLSVNRDFFMYLGMAIAGNVITTSLIMIMARKIAMRIAGIELPYNKCYLVIGVLLAAFALPKLLEMLSHMSQKVFHMSESEVLKNAIDYYFLMVIAVVCFGTQIGLTTFYFNLPYGVYRRLYLAACLAAAFKVILALTDDSAKDSRSDVDDTGNKQSTTEIMGRKLKENKLILLSIPVALVFYLAFPSEHYLYQQFLAPLIIGCVGIRIRKIFIAAFVPSTIVIFVMMMASLSGAINSMATSVRNIRSYWGHISPTDFGTAILMIVCFVWILFKDIPEELFVIPAAFSLFISFYVTRCTTSGYLTVLLIAIFICRAFEKKFVKKKGKLKWGQKIMDVVMMLMFPVLGIITIAMVYAYYKEVPFAGTLNTIFHNRLLPAANMLAEHGLKPFGTFFEMHGFGGSTIHGDNPYTFIDSSYPQILIRYGIVTYILANVMWVYTIWKALETGNRREAFVMTILAMDFVMEHHWYELSYNVFVLLPFADFFESTEQKESDVKRKNRNIGERWKNKMCVFIFFGMCLVQLFVLFLLLPTIFSWLRTIFISYGLYGGGNRNGKIVFAVETFILVMILAFILNLSWLITDILSNEKLRKSYIILLACTCVINFGLLISGNSMIIRITNDNRKRIESERDILEYIIKVASGKVYADKLPEVYIRNIKGMRRSYLCGEDFARYDDATVVTDASWNSHCLEAKGFLYLQISEEDAIYTSDDNVINALKEKGYKLEEYNSYEYKVDLMTLAEMNEVDILDDGDIKLEGTEHQLIHGPYIELYDGRFIAKFGMRLLKDDFLQDDKICTLRLSAFSGNQVKTTVDLYRRDFDDEGNIDFEVAFSGGGQNYEFLVLTEEGVVMEISSISYKRNLEDDVKEKN
ncbi:hypothetical protein [Oribacterium sp. FC2011]|uniref:hypothetical protein n=1 Tax=Oribacterium sp. FC2011 TaxID=1408311 RepID=UPI0012DD3360|nr:hypothetical protein [Oribacterium sp. FC2011]